MANVLGPIFSLQATGSIAKTLTYKKGVRGYVCRKYSKPSGPPSESQLAIRLQTGNLMKNWKTLSIEDQSSWVLLAMEKNLEPINAYMMINYERIDQGLTTTDVYPPVDTPVFPEALIIQEIDDDFDPDASGEYLPDGTWNDLPCYLGIDSQLVLFFNGTLWVIANQYYDGDDISRFTNVDGPTGIYVPENGYIGRLEAITNQP